MAAPTPEDLTGAKRATAWVGAHDDFATQLLAFVHAAHEFGKMPINVAIDFVARITLHHRNVHFGRAQYLSHLEASGWRLVPGSETDGGKVAAMLREMGQDAAADLAEKKSVFGASFQRDERIISLNLESPTKGGGMLVQLSRIS